MSNDFTPADKPLEPGDRLGRYEIREKIGQGGMGTVFRARDTMPPLAGREVAIKVLISGLFDSDSLQRFLGEAHALSRFEHPNIVRIIDCVADEDRPFIVMECLKGEDLNKLLRRGPVDVDRAVDIVLSICAAIAACHRRGIIHRDLKPENVMLHRPEPDIEIVKLLDFSVSKSTVRPDLTNNGFLPGTPRYMSPEQAAGGAADVRSDQYAIALLLHVLLVRRKPFDEYEKPPLSVIARGMANQAKALRPEVPDALDAVLERGLDLDPMQRFGSVHELGSRLLPFSSDNARFQWTRLFTSAPPVEISPLLLSGPNPLAATPHSDVLLNTTIDERNISTARVTPISSPVHGYASAITTKSFGQARYGQHPSSSPDADLSGGLDPPTPSAPPVTLENPPARGPRRRAVLIIVGTLTIGGATALLLQATSSRSVRSPAVAPPNAERQVAHDNRQRLTTDAESPAPEAQPSEGASAVAPSTAPPPSMAAPDPDDIKERSSASFRASRRKQVRPTSKKPIHPARRREPGVEYTDDGSPVLK